MTSRADLLIAMENVSGISLQSKRFGFLLLRILHCNRTCWSSSISWFSLHLSVWQSEAQGPASNMLMLMIPPVLRVIKTLFLLLESGRSCQHPGSCVSLTCHLTGKVKLDNLTLTVYLDIIHIPQNSEIESVHVDYI